MYKNHFIFNYCCFSFIGIFCSYLLFNFSLAQNIQDAYNQAEKEAAALLNETNYLVEENISISEIRGVVKPSKQTIISSQIKAPITKIHADIGEKFTKGDVLIEFDDSIYQLEYHAQASTLESHKIIYANQEKLVKLEGLTQTELLLTELKIQELVALLGKEKLFLEQCVIKAPYDGIVIEKFANEYELVTSDKQLLQLISIANPQIELIVPSNWSSILKVGTKFNFIVDETQKTYLAKTLRTSGIIDPVSKTIKVICDFLEPDAELISGMTGTAYFQKK